ncbi:RES family NAD+ phosphorylase [Pantoea allii]|uniref:RES family NAD+ phosphorylase n=2 Tax=Pantoea allii TaxID=574096 RepID=A0ABS6VFA8_9GAMM|nr:MULTISPECIES: RES family NAD+ phosphorylase [Pantoea]MBW1214402.1 RES family NAD+ phosphorylase [Pantoea allii]MBW1253985.1 RES family NAD+ phosphorylase [Pantoea allii]MBW1257997.1 RES family NAD+ phosphorylase [Pantoea allii]MBW1263254.1 RES family NAD+ phosphorylase [Pantoea allii]MBW1266810.1 RES family NAD+ phosphorylase [Pantoea allii]
MKLYRMTKTRYLGSAWSGFGAREGGGRWNSVGVSMVYASETASLTMLETLIHLQSASVLDSFTLLSIEVPDRLIEWVDINQLPADWAAPEGPAALRLFGDAWVQSGGSVALRVPSALSPVESNYLLNPEHPAFNAIVKQARDIPFRFDARFLR